MDPYLEQPWLWPQIHTRLIVAIADALTPIVRPRYRVSIEQRVYLDIGFFSPSPDDLVGKPDALLVLKEQAAVADTAGTTTSPSTPIITELPTTEEVTERYLEVREVATGAVITAIELLSPSNKHPGAGRQEYEKKRQQALASGTHFIELDLIRSGAPLPMRLPAGIKSDYRIVVSRAWQRPRADLYAFGLRQPIPDFPVPLQRGETEPIVPLNHLLHETYDRAGYDLAIDYRRPLDPPLSPDEAAWIETLLVEAKT